MTSQEMQKRQARAENLKVLKSENGQYFVESSTGKILYRVSRHKNNFACTCGDYAQNIKVDAEFHCKHIMAILNSEDYAPAHYVEKHQPKLDERFISIIKGKDFVLYAGVLDLATQKGLMKLEVDLIQFPTNENGMEAICRATAVSKSGEVFTDFGDANPLNCTQKVSKHIIRVASTRAKGRALRDYCNIGIACLEELADFDEIGTQGAMDRKINTGTKQPAKFAGQKKKIPTKSKKGVKNSVPNLLKISEAQKKAIENLAKRKGLEMEDVDKQLVELFGSDLDHLASGDAGSFIQQLQKSA